MSSSDIKRYGNSGIHTVEGNVAGSRAARLTQEREVQAKEYQEKKRKIEDEHQRGAKIDKMFTSYTEAEEAEFKRQTVGLVTAKEFREKKRNLALHQKEKANKIQDNDKSLKQKKKKKKKLGPLSFSMDEDIEDSNVANKEATSDDNIKTKSLKDPTIDTHFLPDAMRDEEEELEKQRLKQEWEQDQERIKNENVEITYSYWDGSGHRRTITVPKKTTIGQYLEKVRHDLFAEFPELRGVSSDNLLYVKEDLIIPHHFSFYDLIVTRARGKSGPLFHFDIHEDVRMINDVRIEKDESHPGKVVERHWYETNKHIFPASRWEIYDPSVKRDKYTIHGD